VRAIVDILDQVARRWLDPSFAPRQQAIDQISLLTGFSPEMVAHSIDLEQVSSRGQHLIQALTNEIGDPAYLDGFQPNPNLGGYSRAIGPALVGAIFSANIPALPHLEVMRAFLVKAACVGRVSAGEPIFLSLYAQTLAEVDPDLASCLAVLYWERGDERSERLFLDGIDYLVAYGGSEQVSRLMAARPLALDATWHGHRVGFIYICREALSHARLSDLAGRVAYDYSVFDGQACLCPQFCLVERGGDVSPRGFAEACAAAMESWARRLPPKRLELAEASRKYQWKEVCAMRCGADTDDPLIAAPNDLSFAVSVDDVSELTTPPGGRFLRIIPVNGESDAERWILPVREYVQCAALEMGDGDSRDYTALCNRLVTWGVTRLVPAGLMGTPSMMWHHDGAPCLGKMVRWCDRELVRPELLLDSRPGGSPG